MPMKVYTIEDHRYFEYNEICETYPFLTKGCKVRITFIGKHDIPEDRWIYARLEGDEWVSSDGKSKKFDKMFIRATLFQRAIKPKSVRYPVLPDVLELSEEEMFYDNEGNALEILVVGERTPDGVFFRTKDVGRVFGINRLVDVIANKNGDYSLPEHYRLFDCCSCFSISHGEWKIETFVTYEGLLKILFCTRNQKTRPFISWATKTLFVAQMGTASQKRKLANKLSLNADEVQTMCKTTSGFIVCVYLFDLGSVKDLREAMDIGEEYNDSDRVYKFGKTEDLSVRAKSHTKQYGTLKGANIELIYRSDIDKEHAYQAETKIAHFMQAMDVIFRYQRSKELIIASSKQLKLIKEQYDTITELYRGRIKQMTDLIKEKDHVIALTEQKVAIAQQETELVRKDAEILRLKLELANSSR